MNARPDRLAAFGPGPVHLIGIGGAGMSGIAMLLLARGIAVSGSDAKDSPMLAALARAGAQVHVGHDAAHLRDALAVVISSAVRETNPELAAARKRGLPVLARAAALAALMDGRRGIAVAGTHGKTTTTAMLVAALGASDPSYAVGADLDQPGSGAHNGSGEFFVAEADESDGSFLEFAPELAIVTNIELDHTDHYADIAVLRRAFADFTGRIVPGGALVASADDDGGRWLTDNARAAGVATVTFGESPDADLRIGELRLDAGGSESRLTWRGQHLPPLTLAVPGRHNVLDAAAALAAVLWLSRSYDEAARTLAHFRSPRRRLEDRGTVGGVRVVDDYAHNPGKLHAALSAGRLMAGDGRLIVIFQPHLFSRTAAFAREFAAALALADEVIVLDVYAAREEPVAGVTGALIADAVPLPRDRVRFVPDAAVAPALAAGVAEPGDLVMTVGAGDVTTLGPLVLAALARDGSTR